ncbi:TPA: GNAT family N-acetyltransferase [Clostridium perfringens]|nr:GNAT family N-acetyltransferase [Clostridium perfringens]
MGENKREKVFLEFPIIESERFILKEIEEKHRNHFISLFSDEDIMKYSGTEVYNPEKQVEFYFKKVKLMYKEKKGIRWAIINKESKAFIGDIGLYNIDFYSNNTEIGYTIEKNFWRKGVASECIKAIENFAFKILNMNRIIAMIDSNNTSSIKLSEKLGFHKDGILREHYYNKSKDEYINICVYSLIKSDIKVK